MLVYAFRSAKDAHLVGFTAQPDGNNLPPDLAPWTLFSKGTMRTDAHKEGAIGAEVVLAKIKQDGSYLARGNVHVTRRT